MGRLQSQTVNFLVSYEDTLLSLRQQPDDLKGKGPILNCNERLSRSGACYRLRIKRCPNVALPSSPARSSGVLKGPKSRSAIGAHVTKEFPARSSWKMMMTDAKGVIQWLCLVHAKIGSLVEIETMRRKSWKFEEKVWN
uniref:Uncharacterized protein n=1 Tax=Oryza rufipogon TaxID=4529 RepID=A0A0E0QT58_ORYRU